MGTGIMRLVTLWLVASSEAFRVHGASAAPGAKGVQGAHKRGRESSKEVNKKGSASPDVCSVGDSPATCRELTAKYRGGAGEVASVAANVSSLRDTQTNLSLSFNLSE